ESTNMLSRITQFDSRSGGRLDNKSPHLLYQNNQTINSSMAMDGLIGMKISANHEYNSLNAGKSGIQKNPGEITPLKNCFRVKPRAYLSNGEKIKLKNIPMCPISFKSLGWRETNYMNW
ncbi:MAG: hypothetical protein J6568_03305, partial [Snodgrassella sp.]|nr:hypothetical protein [Snodgrassella sp.]